MLKIAYGNTVEIGVYHHVLCTFRTEIVVGPFLFQYDEGAVNGDCCTES